MKKRVPLPQEIYADIVYRSDNTCCMCNTKGRSVQIHHINEDPSCNKIENLILLCLQCHDEVHTKRKLGRALTKKCLEKYRDEWYRRVEDIRNTVDQIIINSKLPIESYIKSSVNNENIYDSPGFFEEAHPDLSVYILSINPGYEAAQNIAQQKYGTGITTNLVQGAQIEYNFLIKTIENLKSFYPKNHFIYDHNEDIISKHIEYIWKLAYRIAAPSGIDNAGTIIHADASSTALLNMKNLINMMVANLLTLEESFTSQRWRPLS